MFCTTMRVTVNLSHFFHDQRSMAKIFIGEKMEFVKDMEDHISKIFKIDNFYLCDCENQYLPSTENIGVLNNNDVIWVIPLRPASTTNEVIVEYGVKLQEISSQNVSCDKYSSLDYDICSENNEKVPKNKKKKHKKKNSNELNAKSIRNKQGNEGDAICDVEVIQKKKQKSKKKRHASEGAVEIKENKEEKSKRKRHASECNVICDAEVKKSKSSSKMKAQDDMVNSNDSWLSEETNDLNAKKKQKTVKSLLDLCKSKSKGFKQNINGNCFVKNEKRINIIKTIIVSGKLTEAQSTDDMIVENSSGMCIRENEAAISFPENDMNGENLEEKIPFSNDSCNASDMCVETKKRKRKRSRRKQRLNISIENNETVSQELEFNGVAKVALPQNCSSVHVRFEEATISASNVREESLEKESAPKHHNIYYVDINRNEDVSVSKAKPLEIGEEFILKHPLTVNIQPRIDDIVAFKILRISESYTPEVSSNIVGKVISYNQETGEILFDLMYGREQCLEPQGKFSVESEEVSQEPTKYACTWSTLLELRLLHP